MVRDWRGQNLSSYQLSHAVDSLRPAYSHKVRKLVAAPADEIFRSVDFGKVLRPSFPWVDPGNAVSVRPLTANSSDLKLDQFADNASIDSKEPLGSFEAHPMNLRNQLPIFVSAAEAARASFEKLAGATGEILRRIGQPPRP